LFSNYNFTHQIAHNELTPTLIVVDRLINYNVLLFHLENNIDFVGKLSDIKRLSYEIFGAGF